MDGEPVVRKEVEINVPVSRVWEALTSSNYTRKYMYMLSVHSDWKEGSNITWTGDSGGIKTYRKGKILKVDPGRFLKFSDFNPSADGPDREENYANVSYLLKDEGDKTLLSVITDHLNGDESRRKDSEGFWDRVLPALKQLLENR